MNLKCGQESISQLYDTMEIIVEDYKKAVLTKLNSTYVGKRVKFKRTKQYGIIHQVRLSGSSTVMVECTISEKSEITVNVYLHEIVVCE